MGFAALGFLPPVAGAILQEGIDVGVILNALRVRTGWDPGAAFPVLCLTGRRLGRLLASSWEAGSYNGWQKN
jgi:hypothetical protein